MLRKQLFRAASAHLLWNISDALQFHSKESEQNSPMFSHVSGAFPSDWYKKDHVGHLQSYCTAPMFPDLNKDGVLDVFYHNHYRTSPSVEWDLGISKGSNDGTSTPWFTSSGAQALVSTESEKYTSEPMDTHGTAFLDIDGDGNLDLYIAVGGGAGYKGGPTHNAALFWGEKDQGSPATLKFRGGRDAASEAKLENENSRGRFNYFADFNRDGLLDVVFSNDVREDNINAPGYMMINKGNRQFKADMGLSEYAFTMMLHDADGDGHANEFVVARRPCLPESGAADSKWHDFCKTRPSGSAGIYRYDDAKGGMTMISPQVYAHSAESEKHEQMVWGMQSGDFDKDGKADLVMLRHTSLSFFHSSDRKSGELPTGEPSFKLEWEYQKCKARGLRAADFDLDGETELLIMCEEAGAHKIYKQGPGGAWYTTGSLGDLSSVGLASPDQKQLVTVCGESGICGGNLLESESDENGGDGLTFGLSVVDWNNDGYVDIAMTHKMGPLLLLRNDAGLRAKHKHIAFKLKGSESNEYGVGATVLFTAKQMGPAGNSTTTQLREIYSYSHDSDWWGAREDRIIFGLGEHGIPQSIEIRWPGRHARKQIINDQSKFAPHINNMGWPMLIEEPWN